MNDCYRDTYEQKYEFLKVWGNLKTLENMNLFDYADVHNGNSFIYWVETKTSSCGNIKGGWATKFGIYGKLSDYHLSPKLYCDDGQYAWYRSLGNVREKAFEEIRKKIVDIVHYTNSGQFSKIESIKTLWPVVKWKIAFLYYNHKQGIKLLPIYSKTILAKFLNESDSKNMMELYQIAIDRYNIKNLDDAFRFVENVFNNNKKVEGLNFQITENYKDHNNDVSESVYRRKKFLPETEIFQKHVEISRSLRACLAQINQNAQIYRETCNIDMVMKTGDNKKTYYEIKTYSTVMYCLREAIGQLLQYAFYGKSDPYPFPEELIVVGEPEPNEYEKAYLILLRKKYNMNLFYQSFNLERKTLSQKY